jgi:heme O synthase-like polyprenyltransferase
LNQTQTGHSGNAMLVAGHLANWTSWISWTGKADKKYKENRNLFFYYIPELLPFSFGIIFTKTFYKTSE